MVAVSDTSPISNLSITGRLDLLCSQFSQVLIPEGVRTELERMPNPEAKTLIENALRDGWLRCRSVGNRQLAAALGNDLDKGEAEAIALATEIQTAVLLIDEKEGRGVARPPESMVVRRIGGTGEIGEGLLKAGGIEMWSLGNTRRSVPDRKRLKATPESVV